MANRFPLIVDSLNLNIKELPSGDNLDLTGSNIYNGTATLTLPTVTGTLATLAGTETLTNKTISSGTLSGTFAGDHTYSGTITLSATSSLTIPVGTTAQRPTAATGQIRFNSSLTSFEGYNGTAWSSLGGVKSVDGYTYIIAETSSGASNGELEFYTETAAGTAGAKQGGWNYTRLLTNTPIDFAGSTSGTTRVQATAAASGTLTLPAATDTLVGKATTDTLTNKTINLASNTLTATSAQIAAAVTDETGSGSLVFATSPTLVTPTLGVATATSINKVAITAPATGSTLTIADGKTLTASNTLTLTGTDGSSVAFGAGGTVAYVANKLSVFAATTSSELAGVISDETGSGSLVFATSPTLVTPILGTPTSGTLTNCTGLPVATGISGLATGIATFLATPSSANLSTALTDETGTGTVVFSASPTFTGTANFAAVSTTGAVSVGGALTVTGDLTVNGTTTTVNSTTITVDDKNLELGSVTTPTNITADGGGITLKGTTDKTFNWVSATSAWTSSEHLALAAGKDIFLSGATSGTMTLAVADVAGTNTITFPAITGNVVTTGDTGTVTNTMLAGSIANAKLANSTISGVALGSNLATLTMGVSGTGLSGSTTYNGSGAATFTVTSNATNANTASAIVARDASGNFSAGTITATISGSISGGTVSGTTLTSTVATGTAPLAVTSTTMVSNLNVDYLDGQHGSYYTTAGNLSGTIPSAVLGNSTAYIGTTAVALNRSSANLALTGISSVTLPGSTSGTIQVTPAAVAGTGTVITLPATTGTVVTTGDSGTVTSTMIADGTIVNADINASAAIAVSKLAASTISGVTLGSNLNSLTAGTGLSGTAYNGSAAQTWTLAASGVTAGSYGGSTAIPVLTIDTYGRVTAASTTSVSTTISLTGTSGTGSVSGGGTLTFASGNGVTATVSGSTVTVNSPQDVRTSAAPTFAGVTSTAGFTATSAGPFIMNATTVAANFSIPSGYNAMTAGPVTINNGITVTVPDGSVWTIV